MDRRWFLKTTAAIAASTALPISPANAMAAAGDDALPEGRPADDGYLPPSWLRYAKTIYFEGLAPPVHPHIRDFDAEHVVRVARELGGDTLRFPAVGAMAYYPSKVLPVSPGLNGRDLVDEISRACRKTGFHLYTYTPFAGSNLLVDYVANHPEFREWVLQGPDGKLSTDTAGDYGWTPAYKLCSTSEVFRKAYREEIRELCAHDIDGIYFDAPNAFEYTGICYCNSCRRDFHAYSGMDLDRLQHEDDLEAKIAWYRWWNQVSLDELEYCRKMIHESGKFLLCHNGGAWRPTSLRTEYRMPDGFMVEHSPQIYIRLMTGLNGASMARPYNKMAQMYLGSYALADKEPSHIKDWAAHCTTMEDGDEILMEGFTNLACGNLPIYAILNRGYYGIGSGSDHPVREVFDVMSRAEPLVKDSVPVPYVSVILSWEAMQGWRTNHENFNVEMSQGFVLSMLDERLSLDVCPSTEVTASWLEKQKVVALCGASGVSAKQVPMLTDWVRNGGSLLATYDTGLYDELGRVQPGGMLKEVLGVDMKGPAANAFPETYYRIGEAHPALGEYRPGEMLMGDTMLVPVAATGSGRVIADCWNLGLNEVRGPAIIVNNFGKGRTVYVAGSLEAHYTTSRVVSLRRMLSSIVRYLAQDAPPTFTIDAPRGVYGICRQTAGNDIVLWVLANIGFKDACIGRMRQEFVTLENVPVKIQVPQGRSVKAVELVRRGQSVPFTEENGYALVKIPSLHVAEIVHLQLG